MKKRSLYCFIILGILPITATAFAGVETCIDTKKSAYLKKVGLPEKFVEGDTVVNNPRYRENGGAPNMRPIPDFVSDCAKEEAERYSLSAQDGWKWIYKKAGSKSQTVNRWSLSTGPEIPYAFEYRAYDANNHGRSALVSLWRTNTIGENIDIAVNKSDCRDELSGSGYNRLKFGSFTVDTIVFYKGEAR